jgi:WD40 repeat protein
MAKNPFKFLDAYGKDDREIFFGRNAETETLYSKVFESKILLVCGVSGTGKSSLIHCGLANKFNDADWLPINVRRGTNINQSLRKALEQSAVTALKPKAKILSCIQSLYLDHFKPIYFIFDQLEELFIFGDEDEKKGFISQVVEIVNSDLACKFIFIIREEYLANLIEFEPYLPTLLNNRIRIEKMTRKKAVETITGPCAVNGIRVEDGFAEELLEKLSPHKTEVELTYLQVFLDKLYKSAIKANPGSVVFTKKTLEDLGHVGDVLSDFLEEQLAGIKDSETALLILKSFVSLEGTKKQITLREIVESNRTLGKDIPLSEISSYAQQFIDLRILRDKNENEQYELRHDALAAKIFEKITVMEKELIEVRHMLLNRFHEFEKREVLLNSDDLLYIAPYEDKLFLNENLKRFISKSKLALTKKRKRQRNVFVAASLLIIVVLSGFTFWAYQERLGAIEQKHEAEKQKREALEAKEQALRANELALIAKEKAEKNESLAVEAKVQAEKARKDALVAKGQAEIASSVATEQSQIAKEQAQKAEQLTGIAEQEKEKAKFSEKRTGTLKSLALAQGLALKSLLTRNDAARQGFLALGAYAINRHCKGPENDPIICEALQSAYGALDRNKHVTFSGSGTEARAIVPVPNGFKIADKNGSIATWDLQSGKIIETEKIALAEGISSLYFSPEGDLLIVGYENTIMNVTAIKAKPEIKSTGLAQRGVLSAVAFSRNGKFYATGSKDSTIVIWDRERFSEVKKLNARASVRCLEFSDDGRSIFCGTENGVVITWDLTTSKEEILFSNERSVPLSISSDPHHDGLAVGFSDGKLRFFSGNENKRVQEFEAHNASVDFVRYSGDGKQLATSGSDKTIKIYDTENPDMNPVVIKGHNARARCLFFGSDGRLYAGCSDKTVRVWDTSSPRLAGEVYPYLNEAYGTGKGLDEWLTFMANNENDLMSSIPPAKNATRR